MMVACPLEGPVRWLNCSQSQGTGNINQLFYKIGCFSFFIAKLPLKNTPVTEKLPGISAMSHGVSASALFFQSRGLLIVPYGARVMEIDKFSE
jgi:hypothetical protein